MKAVLLIHAAATCMLVGLIWFVQLVHYPAFHRVGGEAFVGYEAYHTRAITPLVGVLMLAELATALVLLAGAEGLAQRMLWGIAVVLIALIWLHTAFIAVPLHERLGGGYDAATVNSLVNNNWVRTVAWTLRGALIFFLMAIRMR